MLRMTGAALTIILLSAAPAAAEMVRRESPHPAQTTMDRLEAAIKERGLRVFARINHAAGAKQEGQDLRPTILIIFGSPAVGTPLIQAEQTMGLSLPMRALVWQDAVGKVWVGYDAPAGVVAERGLPKDHPVAVRITGALGALAEAATKP
jgi:uncharacterized protein (DUF302 family)